MAWVYILKCKDDSYYVGSTPDLERRVAEHQAGILCDYTSRRRPVELVYCQEMTTLVQAFRAERQLKGWSRRKKEAIIAVDTTYYQNYLARDSRKRIELILPLMNRSSMTTVFQ